jgi:hypothetical protein
MNTEKDTKENSNLPIFSVSISSLIKKADAENKENRRKMFSNITKQTKDIEPYDNADFLNMVGAIKGALN